MSSLTGRLSPQRDLEEAKKRLKTETAAAEKSSALRDRARAELDKVGRVQRPPPPPHPRVSEGVSLVPQLPSHADLSLWATAVLADRRPPADLDTKCLLSMVKTEDVQRVVEEKEAELAWLEEMVEDK